MTTKFYVTMTDTFFSGWGQAEGKKAKYVYECDSYQEAQIVQENALSRSDQKNVNICSNKPSYNPKTTLTKWKNKEDSKEWYIKNNFKN